MSEIAVSSENHVSMSSIVLIQYNQFVSKFINLIHYIHHISSIQFVGFHLLV